MRLTLFALSVLAGTACTRSVPPATPVALAPKPLISFVGASEPEFVGFDLAHFRRYRQMDENELRDHLGRVASRLVDEPHEPEYHVQKVLVLEALDYYDDADLSRPAHAHLNEALALYESMAKKREHIGRASRRLQQLKFYRAFYHQCLGKHSEAKADLEEGLKDNSVAIHLRSRK